MTTTARPTVTAATIADFASIDEANQAVLARMGAGQPTLVDVAQAHTFITELAPGRRVLLHAGPPIEYANFPDTIKGSCVGGVLFEGWADDEAGARALLEAGEVELLPCHSVNAVGPMGGITSAHMALIKVVDTEHGTTAYSTMNEGIGKVLRFGAYDAEVIERLGWMRDVLGPTLAAALRHTEGGYPLAPLIARAITMGDEMHQRNIAASALFAKDMAPLITRAVAAGEVSADDAVAVQGFLAATDQFFLNIAMAAAKSIMDAARQIEAGSVVTAMCRNGYEFGIRVAALGDRWFTAPVNIPTGLFFTGYEQGQACPDMGDSAITETYGLGGMSMIAAPGVTRFIGAGGFDDALQISEEMSEIVAGHNPALSIPTWDFQGAPSGIDVRKVVQTGITPLINTGIAHKDAGVGQIGAGTVRAPLGCFTAALEALAEVYGVQA